MPQIGWHNVLAVPNFLSLRATQTLFIKLEFQSPMGPSKSSKRRLPAQSRNHSTGPWPSATWILKDLIIIIIIIIIIIPIWIPMIPFSSLWFAKAPHSSLWIPVVPYGPLWIPMAHYDFVWLHMYLYGFQWLPTAPDGFLWLLITVRLIDSLIVYYHLCSTLSDIIWIWLSLFESIYLGWLCLTLFDFVWLCLTYAAMHKFCLLRFVQRIL